jgi:hypothetical protein
MSIREFSLLALVLVASFTWNSQGVSGFTGLALVPKSFSLTTAESTRASPAVSPRPFSKFQDFRAIALDRPKMTEPIIDPSIVNIERQPQKEDVPKIEQVPTTMSEAVRVFFFSGDFGPLYVVISLLAMSVWRLNAAVPLELSDLMAFASAVVFWWIQEHVIHQRVLHSQWNWVGKEIHEGHHAKPYFHVSIDPAGLLLTWLAVAHVILRCIFSSSLPLAVSATVGYASAGLFYEWAHYIVHTRVPLSGSEFWTRVKANHIRHHCVNHDYWFAFSLPLVDDLFQTNPSVKEARRLATTKNNNNNKTKH